MKKDFIQIFALIVALFVMVFSVPAMSADVVPVAANAVATDAGVLAWIMANTTSIVIVLLAVSEFLALIPGLSGNGILDSIIKILKSMAGKAE